MWGTSGMGRIIKDLVHRVRQQYWPPKAEIRPEANNLEGNWAESMDMAPLGPDTELLCELRQISWKFQSLNVLLWKINIVKSAKLVGCKAYLLIVEVEIEAYSFSSKWTGLYPEEPAPWGRSQAKWAWMLPPVFPRAVGKDKEGQGERGSRFSPFRQGIAQAPQGSGGHCLSSLLADKIMASESCNSQH